MTATTTLGTPASPKWDDAWLAEVDRVEQDLGRRICGAHSPAFTPCKLGSTHPNGRCRFHGGAAGIGAPNGNRNAWVHGLYSRRLQQCGDHCPLWKHCPMAGRDILEQRPAERPHCVYEQDEYDATLSTLSLEKEKVEPKEIEVQSAFDLDDLDQDAEGPVPSHSSHASYTSHTSQIPPLRVSSPPREPGLVERNVALFQVMLSRAQAALGVARLTDETHAIAHRYEMRSVRVSALVQAQLHIARELRQWLKLLPGFDPRSKPVKPEPDPNAPKGLPDLMKPILEEAEVVFDELLGPGGFPGRGVPPRPHSDPPATPA